MIRWLKNNKSESMLVSLQQRVAIPNGHLKLQKDKLLKARAEIRKFRRTSRTYFDRFCCEVEQRKETMRKEQLASHNKFQTLGSTKTKGQGGVSE